MYEKILRFGKIDSDESAESIELRLSGLVIQQQNKLEISNLIYATVFDKKWLEDTLRELQPYAQELASWLASDCKDTSYLLQGDSLKNALSWASARILSVTEYQFLLASQEFHAQNKYTSIKDNLQKEVVVESKNQSDSAWKKLIENKITLEQAINLLIDSEKNLLQEAFDPKVHHRFIEHFPKNFEFPPIIPLLLWKNCYFVASVEKINPDVAKVLMQHTKTKIEFFRINYKSYSEFPYKLNLQNHNIYAEKLNDLLAYKQAIKAAGDIKAFLKMSVMSTDNPLKQLELIIAGGVHQRASDIHFEPLDSGLRVRFRIDGLLREVIRSEDGLSSSRIVSALKAQADMNVSERRLPHDGRLRMQYSSNSKLDIRINTIPCVYGEKAVVRLLPEENPYSSLDDLGFMKSSLTIYKSWIEQSQGIVIICGPTSSGKTSTLYTTLQSITNENINLSTIEDPIEYILPGINQMQVHESIGMTFANGLRALLRQDPDVVMVGEIRDQITAETAIRAGLTGHLVLTTLHTNDAVSAITRLISMGISPSLICDALLGVVSQRLVRKVCSDCSQPVEITKSELQYLGLEASSTDMRKSVRGIGCFSCGGTGYSGREAIVELLTFDPVVKQLVREARIGEMYSYLSKNSINSFRLAALEKIFNGITNVDELKRVLPYGALHPDVSEWVSQRTI
ncbi:ATPase, T2SS/T4P/T4SS family [Tumidithrix helvetica]|uniref:ATPase, T2SS/T4P/T4SS family n=1 Tax=Tumidithrix helvetica TaxID=3457545 RepID=UPI003CC698AD